MAHHPLPPKFTWHRQLFFVLVQAASIICACWWYFGVLPAPGYSIGMLAVAAAVMSVHPDMQAWQRSLWMLLIGAFLIVEFRAIDKDRKENQESQERIRKEDRESFQAILKQGTDNFRDLLKDQRDSFKETTRLLFDAQRQERVQFAGVLKAQQDLFEHEEQLAQSFNGKLVAGNDPTPGNYCPQPTGSEAIVMFGDDSQHNGALVTTFPHTVLRSQRFGPMITLDREGSLLSVILDIKSNDGRIIARLNKDGWVANRNNYLELRKDKSSLVIIDEFGAEVLNVRYLNPQAVSVKGKNIGLPAGMTYVCAGGSGGADYAVP